MIRIDLQVELNYEIDAHGADFIFNVHAARTPCQSIQAESLRLSQPVEPHMHTDPASGNRYLRLRAGPGELSLAYAATVDLAHHHADAATLPEVPVQRLPPQVLGYIYPSRYCQSDRLIGLSIREFGHLPRGHARVQAICDWVRHRVTFTPLTFQVSVSAVAFSVEFFAKPDSITVPLSVSTRMLDASTSLFSTNRAFTAVVIAVSST